MYDFVIKNTYSFITNFINNSLYISDTHRIPGGREALQIKSITVEALLLQAEEHSELLITRQKFLWAVTKRINRTQECWPRTWPKQKLRDFQCFCTKTYWQDFLFSPLTCLPPLSPSSYPSLTAVDSTLFVPLLPPCTSVVSGKGSRGGLPAPQGKLWAPSHLYESTIINTAKLFFLIYHFKTLGHK